MNMNAPNELSSSTLPSLPGFLPPISLRHFLRTYFFCDLGRYCAAADPAAITGVDVVCPAGAVFVYVGDTAPPPPLTNLRMASLGSTPSAVHVAKGTRGSSFVEKVLSSPFWSSLLAQLDQRVITYLTQSCAVVQQFEAGQGALQVLGVKLTACVRAQRGRAFKRPFSWVRRGLPQKKRLRTEADLEPIHRDISRDRLVGRPHSERCGEFEEVFHVLHTKSSPAAACASAASVTHAAKRIAEQYFGSSKLGAQQLVHATDAIRALILATASVDYRGALVRCVGNCCADNAARNVRACCASRVAVRKYISCVLSEMQRRAPLVHCTTFSFGGQENVAALTRHVMQWVSVGRRGPCPASIFLEGVHVGKILWLRQISSSTHQSMRLQKLFCCFVSFLMEEVVPLVLRQSFQVTWSTRQPNTLIFVPLVWWRTLRKRELVRILKTSTSGTEEGPMALTRVSKSEIEQRAVASPLHFRLLFSCVRLLIDGNKLRPIAVVKVAEGSVLAKTARAAPAWSRQLQRQKQAKHRDSDCLPGRVVLREVLECLHAAQADRRGRLGLPQTSNLSHTDEYAMFLNFVKSCRTAEDSSTPIYLKFDATRCYDRLPQPAVQQAISAVVCHNTYVRVPLRALHMRCGVACVRDWNRMIVDSDFARGVLPRIPMGWVVCEEGPTTEVAAQCVRDILAQHTLRHLVCLEGRLYVQHRGITQGSSVATLLCDAVVEAVDTDIVSVLSEHDAPSLLIRRTDDVLVVTCSPRAAAAIYSKAVRGWPDAGYECNAAKLETNFCPDSTRRASTPQVVHWCGLRIVCGTMPSASARALCIAPDWRRVSAVECAQTMVVKVGCDRDVGLSSLRFLRMLQLRTPCSVFCVIINGRQRVMQTLLELALVWARFAVEKMLSVKGSFRPHPRVLLRPFAIAKSITLQHIKRKQWELMAQSSTCPLSDLDVDCAFSCALLWRVRAVPAATLSYSTAAWLIAVRAYLQCRLVRRHSLPDPNPLGASHLCQHVLRLAALAATTQ